MFFGEADLGEAGGEAALGEAALGEAAWKKVGERELRELLPGSLHEPFNETRERVGTSETSELSEQIARIAECDGRRTLWRPLSECLHSRAAPLQRERNSDLTGRLTRTKADLDTLRELNAHWINLTIIQKNTN